MRMQKLCILLITLQVMLVFGKVYQHNRHLALLYTKQKIEEKLKQTLTTRDMLFAELSYLKSPQSVKKYVQKNLNFVPLKQTNIVHVNTLLANQG